LTEQAEKQEQDVAESVSPEASNADSALPDIQPPNAGFILQLFLIPMMIVTVIIGVWLLFNFISRDESPTELVRGLQKMNNASWQKAYTLSSMLRNPSSADLKNDEALAGELIAILNTELTPETTDENQIKLRIFVCKCLGEFEIDAGMPALLQAAQQSRNEHELAIALTAVESLAVLIQNLGPDSLDQHGDPGTTLIAISNAPSENPDYTLRVNQIRSAAGYALGVLGTEAAKGRLESMLKDAYPNARFNAAVGLARHGNLKSTPVLLEMLDPDNAAVVQGEPEGSYGFKRSVVMINAIRGVDRLAEFHSPEELKPLLDALKSLDDGENIDSETRLIAKDAVRKITTK